MRILINLLSEQTIQNIVAIRHFEADKVIVLTTPEYIWQVDNFEKITGVPHEKIEVLAYSMQNNMQQLTSVIEQFSENDIVVNYTGGTKIMAMAVMLKVLLSVRKRVSLAYVNTRDLLIEEMIINEDKTLTAENHILTQSVSINEYFIMKGESIDSYDFELNKSEEERLLLSKQLMKNNVYLSLFRKQQKFFIRGIPLVSHRVATSNKFDLFWDKDEILLRQGNKVYDYKHGDGGQYFTGAWLEELIFDKLHKSDRFDNVIKNLKINFKSGLERFNKNEMDVVVTKGFKTAFVECKAGNIKQEHIYKLRAITDYFLGSFGVAIIVARFKPQENIIEKCKDLGVHIFTNIEFDYLDVEIEKLLK
ncbi:MAG: hypothetical protein DRI86_08100 [Bacteroidetes bacterium]|nr:MAG: hypothetical protein DRI86_08100 [Bacteroidota bacterium]